MQLTNMRVLEAIVAMALTCTVTVSSAQQAGSVIEVAGTVMDSEDNPLENVVVKATPTDISPVLTDALGRYRFYIVGQQGVFTLSFEKPGFQERSSPPIPPRRRVTFDVVLNPTERPTVVVRMEEFVSGAYISGTVEGLNTEAIRQHKVLVYVLTDNWYSHPYAENAPGRGYAPIEDDGSWRIRTVNRHHNPHLLAMLVVPRTYVPPATITPDGEPQQSLRVKIGSNLVGSQIVEAPSGL